MSRKYTAGMIANRPYAKRSLNEPFFLLMLTYIMFCASSVAQTESSEECVAARAPFF